MGTNWLILAQKDEVGTQLDATVGVQKTGAQMGRENTCTLESKFQPAKGEQDVYKSFVLSVKHKGRRN